MSDHLSSCPLPVCLCPLPPPGPFSRLRPTLLLLLTLTGPLMAAAPRRAPASAPNPNVVRIQVEHTLFHPIDNVSMQVERLNGRMVARPGKVISLDDQASYTVQVDQAVTRLSAANLTTLINSYLLRQADSAVRRVDVSFEGQQMIVKGTVHKLIDLPFEGRGVISATPEGDLRLHMESFKVGGALTKGFLEFFGIHLDAVAKPRAEATFRVEGDDFITSLSNLFPPPRVYGHLTRVHVEGQDMVQIIGIEVVQHPVQTIPKALPSPANYVYFTGGRMRFGKVTMDNVDLKLVNRTPKEAFDFSLAHYQQQIQQGYVKITPAFGLIVYAEDYSDVLQKKP